MTGAELLPATAWEQAAIIGIFIVFVGVVFGWIAKSEKDRQLHQAELSKQNREFQAQESEKWQRFIGEVDDKWRAFNREQRVENTEAQKCVETSMQGLTTVIQGLVSEVREMRDDSKTFYKSFHESFHAHDAQAKEILAEVKTSGKPAPKPRVKKDTDA